jgi:hypothetical protein
MTDTPLSYEYFLHPVSADEAARIALPAGLTNAEKEAFAANPPAEAIARAERWPLPKAADAAVTVAADAPLADLTAHYSAAQLDPDREEY